MKEILLTLRLLSNVAHSEEFFYFSFIYKNVTIVSLCTVSQKDNFNHFIARQKDSNVHISKRYRMRVRSSVPYEMKSFWMENEKDTNDSVLYFTRDFEKRVWIVE